MKNFICLIFCIRYYIQDYFEYIFKRHETLTDNPPIQIQINRTENRITFETKTSYYHEFLTPETRKLLGSKERKITKDKDGENIPKLEITKVILIHHNLVNNIYQQIYHQNLFT